MLSRHHRRTERDGHERQQGRWWEPIRFRTRFGTRTSRSCVLTMRHKGKSQRGGFGWTSRWLSTTHAVPPTNRAEDSEGICLGHLSTFGGFICFVKPARPLTCFVDHWIGDSGIREEEELEIFHRSVESQGEATGLHGIPPSRDAPRDGKRPSTDLESL